MRVPFLIPLQALAGLLALAPLATAQSYSVVSVINPGTITGTVKWAGARPKPLSVPITKDQSVCDPNSAKNRDLERLEVGEDGGVADTVVYLANITQGKPMDLPQERRSLNQQHCRYEPHISLVPQGAEFKMNSSDPILHNLHMTGAATYNKAFVTPDRPISETLQDAGEVHLECYAGHTWMNAEILVVRHPYYAVTDEHGKFTLTGVPPGEYQIVAWHEGWHIAGRDSKFDVFSQLRYQHLVFSEPVTWTKKVSVGPNQEAAVNFEISERSTPKAVAAN
jgi:hypothetical protein